MAELLLLAFEKGKLGDGDRDSATVGDNKGPGIADP
jgi:hypothetical protein